MTVLQWTLRYMCLFSVLVSSGYMPRSGVAGLYGNFIPSFFFFFLKNLHTVFYSDYQLTCPPAVQECSLFSTPSPAVVLCGFFDDGHSDLSHCSFDLCFSNNEWCWASCVFISHLCVFFGEMFLEVFCYFLIGLFVSLTLCELLVCFGT